MSSSSSSSTAITFFSNRELDTLTLGERDPRLSTLTNSEDVGDTSSKDTVKSVLDVNNFKATNVTFTVNELTNTTNVTTTSNHDNVTDVELDEIFNLASFEVEADGVVSLDQRIRVTDGTTIVGGDVGNTLSTNQNLLNLAQFVLGFFISDAVNSKATFNVIDETEVFTSFFNLDNVCYVKLKKASKKKHPGFVKA